MIQRIKDHLKEYREKIEEHRRAIVALTGAIQALERLESEDNTEEEEELKHGDK